MIISFYGSSIFIYVLIYSIFRVLFYFSSVNFLSSFLPMLYLISISKVTSIILGITEFNLAKRMREDDYEVDRSSLNNQNQIHNNENSRSESDSSDMKISYFFEPGIRLKYICLIICSSVVEMLFQISFNKIFDNDTNYRKRAHQYLIDNKFFLLLITLILFFCKKEKNLYSHHILSLSLIFLSQIIVYIISYKEIIENFGLVFYSFFMNILYAFQIFIEKEISSGNRKLLPPIIIGMEGVFELVVSVILNCVIKITFNKEILPDSLPSMNMTFKGLFIILCFLLSEIVRIKILSRSNEFYICLSEQIVYIYFTFYYVTKSKELIYIPFQILIIFSFLIFVEIFELNFCGLNRKTERYLREDLFGNNGLFGVFSRNLSSQSTESRTGSGSGGGANRNDSSDNGNENGSRNRSDSHSGSVDSEKESDINIIENEGKYIFVVDYSSNNEDDKNSEGNINNKEDENYVKKNKYFNIGENENLEKEEENMYKVEEKKETLFGLNSEIM